MKRNFMLLVGSLLILGSLAGLFMVYVRPNQMEAQAVEEIREQVAEATEAAATEAPESKAEAKEEETSLYPWLTTATTYFQGQKVEWGVNLTDGQELGTSIGVISCPELDIEVPVVFGGTEDIFLEGQAGLHEELSTPDSLFVLGHHMKWGLFKNLCSAEKGQEVTLETIYGTYTYEITYSAYISEAEYEADNYKVCQGADLTLATCDYVEGVKGRRIVKCDLITE